MLYKFTYLLTYARSVCNKIVELGCNVTIQNQSTLSLTFNLVQLIGYVIRLIITIAFLSNSTHYMNAYWTLRGEDTSDHSCNKR